jgi:hypothetical protein
MKINFPYFDNVFNGVRLSDLGTQLRDLVRSLEIAFNQININGELIIGGGTKIVKHLSASATWNPANLANGAQQYTDVTVTGAMSGDEVTVSFTQPLQGIIQWGEVVSSNTVRVYHRNETGAGIDLASGTVRASVWRH